MIWRVVREYKLDYRAVENWGLLEIFEANYQLDYELILNHLQAKEQERKHGN